MKRESREIKEEEKERERVDGRPGRKRQKERERMGLKPTLYRPLGQPHVLAPIYLVKNPLPVDVGIIGQTTSNIVSLWLCFLSPNLVV
jgi:hypothetical protein